ncbi:putative sodium-coupled neutral amino acid transporter 11 [Littorina saxatilis]|uniref:putative sodium-coupled neutral amino acid transporter 11 n=1 Tax=Littorina saxatilis TaxID=31220 RepID=UPI0038B4F872
MANENSYILGRSQTTSDFSETSSVSDMRHLVEEKEDGKQRSSIPMTSFNFINSIIGSGIIGMPFALKQAGFGLGILMIVAVALITDYSILTLVKGGHLSNTDSYQDLVLVTFGRPGFYVLTVLQFLYPFIAMVSYNVIIGDTITKIILWMGGDNPGVIHSVLGNRQFVIFIVTVLITLPLSLYRNIGKLGKWAFLSIILISFIVVACIIRLSTFAHTIAPTENAWQFANYNVTQAIGIMAFAYMCHHNTFLIHSSLEKPTQQRWGFVVHFSVSFAMLMCLLLGIVGYISFTGFTQGDLLENYCWEDTMMNIARIAFAITIMLTFPVECFVTREVVENAVFPSNPGPSPLWRHITVTVIIVFLVGAVSMATDCLGIVLTFNGVLIASPLAYIIPPLCVMRLRQEALLSRANVGPVLLALFGLFVMVVGTVMGLLETIYDSGNVCSHGAEPVYCPDFAGGNASSAAAGASSTQSPFSTTPLSLIPV